MYGMADNDTCPRCRHPFWQHLDGDGCTHFACICMLYRSQLENMAKLHSEGEDPALAFYASNHAFTKRESKHLTQLRRQLERL